MNFITKHIRLISITVFVLVVALILFLSQYAKETKRTFFCFDTLIDISLSGKNAEKAADEIESALKDMEKTYSKYRPDSVVSEFNRLATGERLVIPDEMADLIRFTVSVSEKTDGAFDITTSKLSDLWNIKTATTPPTEEDILDILKNTGYKKIILDGNTLTKTNADIDFGGILKGFAADKVRTIAKKHGVTSGIVNLGGNVCLIGLKDHRSSWSVGITNPFSPGEIYLTVGAENESVITSGAYQRFFEFDGKTYHHILSPETGYPADTDVASVTIISHDGTLADALSTAIFVQGSEKGFETAKKFDVGVLIITKDGNIISDKVNYRPYRTRDSLTLSLIFLH